MIVEFVMGRTPSGEYRRTEFEASIDYPVQPLDFFTGPKRIGQNIAEILKRYAEIDAIRGINFISKTSIPVGRVNTFLDARILIFPHSEIVSWRARTHQLGKPSPLTPSLERRLLDRAQPQLLDLKPVIAGTARSILPTLREQAREEIRTRAEQQARSMLTNAEAILTYLNRPF